MIDLPLSTFANKPPEVHAIGHGFVAGLTGRGINPTHPDSKAEPHYYKLGWVIGRVPHYTLFALTGAYVLP